VREVNLFSKDGSTCTLEYKGYAHRSQVYGDGEVEDGENVRSTYRLIKDLNLISDLKNKVNV